MSDPSSLGQGEVPHLQGQEGAPGSSELGGEGDPITISDESREGLPSSGDHVVAEGSEIPQVEGRTPWPTGLHTVEEEKKKKAMEE